MKKLIFLLIACLTITGCKNDKKLEKVVIYSSMEEFRNAELSKQIKQQFPKINVNIQQLTTGNNAAKLKAEGLDTKADIVLGLEKAYMESLSDNFASLKDYD
ncbi:MAG: ABC transporter substrate-binding protein, partial [Bacilli bacterium]